MAEEAKAGAGAQAGQAAPGGGNTAQTGAAMKAADQGGNTTGTLNRSQAKSDFISKAREELEKWFETHFRQSNELSQDTPLFNAVHAAKESIHAVLGERG